nr:MAG TPA: hypothetical protein [Caudoviricetes sp.]
MSNLIINGVSVVPPKSFQVNVQDVDGETGRNANDEQFNYKWRFSSAA